MKILLQIVIKMKSNFFELKKFVFTFEWNAASKRDWEIIRRNFVAAYLFAYKDCELNELKFSSKLVEQATNNWDSAYKKSHKDGY